MIKTFSSRAGRLSDTNKKFLNLKSKALLDSGKIPKTQKPVVIDIGFGDAQSFVKDVIENQDYLFIGIEPYKKGFARAIQFYEENKCKNLFLFNGDIRDFFEKMTCKVNYLRIHFPDPWPKKKHIKRRLISKEFLSVAHQNLKKGGSMEIVTDSSIYQKHIEELIGFQNYFKIISSFPITYQISTFNKKARAKGHKIKEYILEKVS